MISSYPKEWLVNEIKRDELLKYDLADIKSFEPWWKLILGNKALLPLLWSMYPNHPNLLPAFYDDPSVTILKGSSSGQQYLKEIEKYKWVSKPLFGREGQGVLKSSNYSNFNDFRKATEQNLKKGSEEMGRSIYQLYTKLPEVQGRVIQTSSWVIGGEVAGINFREGKAGTDFADFSPFVPHYVSNKRRSDRGQPLQK